MIVRIHNAALQRGMTANEAKVYVYLLACSNCLNNAIVRAGKIAESCGISSRATVHAALDGLCEKGLVSKYRRKNADNYYIANGYNITPLPGGWFLLDTQDMRVFQLDKAAFLVYLYFLKCKSHRSNKVFPSLRRISRALRTCKNTVIAAIRRLIQQGFIQKARPASAGRVNLYTVVSGVIEVLSYKKRNAAPLTKPRTNHLTAILAGFARFVNSLFAKTKRLLSFLS